MNLIVRPASNSDCRFLYELRKTPQYQPYCYSPFEASYENHLHWFASRMSSPTPLLYICSIGDCSIGYVRFEPVILNEIYEISFAMHLNVLGKGYSVPMVRSALDQFCTLLDSPKAIRIIATAARANIASQAVLAKLRFMLNGQVVKPASCHTAREFTIFDKYTLIVK